MLRIIAGIALIPSLAWGQIVMVNHDNGLVPLDKVQFAIWDWNNRIGTQIVYGGETHGNFIPNFITIRISTFEEWGQRELLGYDAVAIRHAEEPGCEILISPYLWFLNGIYQGLVSHEISHCLGGLHTPDILDTLYYMAGNNGITSDDVDSVLASPLYPIGQVSKCHATLDQNWTLFIPQIGGYLAKLEYVGFNKWRVVNSGLYPSDCAGNVLSDDRAELVEVRVYPSGRYHATLVKDGGDWRLTSAIALP